MSNKNVEIRYNDRAVLTYTVTDKVYERISEIISPNFKELGYIKVDNSESFHDIIRAIDVVINIEK